MAATLKPPVSLAQAAGRVSGRMLRGNRFVDAGLEAGRIAAVAATRAASSLWLQVTGVFFALFAGVGFGASVWEYSRYDSGSTGPERMLLGAGFTAMFAWFAVSSFWRCRRKGD